LLWIQWYNSNNSNNNNKKKNNNKLFEVYEVLSYEQKVWLVKQEMNSR